MSDDFAKELHDKAIRGQALSEEEKQILENCYRKLDQEESVILNVHVDDDNELLQLQYQIEDTVKKITSLARWIQAVGKENKGHRDGVAGLRRQLAQPTSSQPI